MSEDSTKDLTTDEMLRLLLADMRDVKGRLGALEAQGEDRTKTTRPLLDQIIREMVQTRETLTARLEGVEKELRSIDRKFDILNKELFAMKTDIREQSDRLTELETRPN